MAKFRRLEKVSTWRSVAVHTWARPADPTVYGTLELDCENALAYVERLRATTGEKVTITHLIGKGIALAIAERPEINAILRRGSIWLRDTVDVFFQVAFEGGEDLAGAKVTTADQKSVTEIAAELRKRAERIRTAKDHPTQKSAGMMSKMPGWMVGPAMRFGETLSYDYGLDLSKLGIPYDAFGSCMITNVGGFGLEVGHAPLLPFSRVPLLLTVGEVRDAPCVRDGKLVVGKRIKIGATFDHRLLDGFQAGMLSKRFSAVFQDPARELGPVPDKARGAEGPAAEVASAS